MAIYAHGGPTVRMLVKGTSTQIQRTYRKPYSNDSQFPKHNRHPIFGCCGPFGFYTLRLHPPARKASDSESCELKIPDMTGLRPHQKVTLCRDTDILWDPEGPSTPYCRKHIKGIVFGTRVLK